MIYVIHATGTEFVKIGVAKNPITRLRHLQTGIPMTLVLLASADWPDQYEKRFHRVLRDVHVRGEWYKSCQRIDCLIKSMQSGAQDPLQWLKELGLSTNRLARVLAIAR